MADDVQTRLLQFIASVVLHNSTVAQRLGLGASDSQFLSLLDVHGPLTAGRLAEESGLTTGTVTGVLDRLERAGFVRRERDEHDRRRVLAVLDPAGMARMAEHYRAHGEHLDRVLAARSPAELQIIGDFLADLVAGPGGAPS